MKNRHWILALATSLALFAGCSKTEDASSPKAGAPAPAAGQVPAAGQSATTAAIASHLEYGGEFYGVVDVKGELEKMGDMYADMIAQMAKTNPNGAMVANLDWHKLFQRLGLYDITGGGVSSWSAANDPFHHNRFFLYTPNGRTGLLKMFGGAPEAFVTPGLAPADADLVMESTVDLKSLSDLIMSYAKDVGGPNTVAQANAGLSQPLVPGTTLTGQSLIDRLNTRIIVIARADPKQTIQVSPEVTTPMVDLLISLDGFADVLDQLQPILDGMPVTMGEKNGMKTVTLAMPIPGAFATYQPMIVADPKSKRLYLVSRPSFADETIFGQGARLSSSTDFKVATDGLPTQGNSLGYMSKKGADLFVSSYKQILKSMSPQLPSDVQDKISTAAFSQMTNLSHGQAGTRVNLSDGIMFQSVSGASAKNIVLVAPVLAVGLTSAMAIPAFSKVRQQSRDKAISNNLRMIATAAQQYMLEKGVTQVRYQDLVGPEPGKYIRSITPVNGESYDGIVIRADTTSISVTTGTGEIVKYDL